jgi:hypothetical protein
MIDGFNIKFMIVCALMGAFGQLIRSFMGFYKIYMDPNATIANTWEWKRFIISVFMGMMIGFLLGFIYKSPLSNTDVLGIIAASYGGSDFLEGFLENRGKQVK